MRCVFYLLLLIFAMLYILPAKAQTGSTIVYIWQNRITAQPLDGSTPIALGVPFYAIESAVPETLHDVYRVESAPIESPSGGYGFYHGVWSPDRTQFVYVELESAGTGYRVQLVSSGDCAAPTCRRNLLSMEITDDAGFLDPLGWTVTGDILLAERHTLQRMDILRGWKLNIDTGRLESYLNYDSEPLDGRSAVLPDGSGAFIGFDIAHNQGYVLDFETKAVLSFRVTLDAGETPRSVFELYHSPLAVLGAMSQEQLDAFTASVLLQTTDNGAPPRPEPFLHWSLADVYRTITCYPDSNWTKANFAFTCPALSAPRAYSGHQGTDIGGLPNGLPLDTDVFAAAPGRVIATNDRCDNSNPSCGSAYGNYVLLEHAVEVNGMIQIWLTGYAHLNAPLVEVGQYVTDITEPIALSGDTGVGGAHLHVEVRNILPNGANRWVDPWGGYYPPYGESLWIGGNDEPVPAADASIDDVTPTDV